MSGPLTEEQKATIKATTVVFNDEAEAIEAALARLDYLERKVQAAEAVQRALDDGDVSAVNRAMNAYDEVTE